MEKISLLIGAAFAASFNSTLGSAPKRLGQLGAALQRAQRAATADAALKAAADNLQTLRDRLMAVQAEALKVRAAIRSSAGGGELVKLRADAERLGREATSLSGRLERARTTVRELRQAHSEAAAAADRQTGVLRRQGATLEQLRRQHAAVSGAFAAHTQATTALHSRWGRVVAGVAAGAGVKSLVAASFPMQSILVDIGITADESAKRMRKVGQALGEVSRLTTQPRRELAQGLKTLVASGLPLEQAEGAMQAMAIAATASGASMEDIAKTTFSVMSNLKIAPDQVGRAMDLLVTAGNLGGFELVDMARFFPMLTGEVEKLGVKGTEAIGMLGTALQIARRTAANPEEAANNMKNYLAKLTAPETIKRFQKHGVDLERRFKGWVAQGLNPIEESLRLVRKMTKGGDPFRIGELFNDMQAKGYITPLMLHVDDYKPMRQKLADAAGSSEHNMSRRIDEDPALRFRALGEALGELRDNVMELFMPTIMEWATGLNKMVRSVREFALEHPKLVSGLVTIGAVVAGVAVAGSAFGVLGAGLKTVFTGLRLLGVMTPIGAALTAVAAVIGLVVANWDTIGPAVGRAWEAMKEVGGTIADWVTGIGVKIGTFMINVGKSFAEGIRTIVEDWVGAGMRMVEGLIAGIRSRWEAMKTAVGEIGQALASTFRSVLGISSPSRVFTELGQAVGDGAARGILSGAPGVGRAAAALGMAATVGFAPSLSTAMPSRSSVPIAATQQITINVHQRPGEDSEALARRVAALIRQQQALERRAALGDWA